MRKTAAVILIFVSCRFLYADIIVTTDDMILNGKIIDEKPDSVTFGNFYGTFVIKRTQIRELFRTKNFHEDIEIFRNKGRSIEESEARTNYEAGVEKLGVEGKAPEPSSSFALGLSPFLTVNYGKLKKVLPYGFGCALTADVSLGSEAGREFFVPDLRLGISYLHSEKGREKISGAAASAGPFWSMPVSIGEIRFTYCLSPGGGIGIYRIDGIDERKIAAKWNVFFSTGPSFVISPVVLYPHLKLEYIYDRIAPLYGIGFGMGIGYRF